MSSLNRLALPLLTALALLAPSAAGQLNRASASLYTRVEGSELQLAIWIDIDRGLHLYHHDKGPEDAVGMETRIELEAEGVTFDPLIWPEPERYEQPGLGDGGRDTYIFGHHGKLTLFGRGTLAEGVTDPEVTVKLDGLTCEDGGACYRYEETIESRGKGREKHWRDYPTDGWVEQSASDSPPAPEEEQLGESHLSGELQLAVEGNRVHGELVLELPMGEHLGHTEVGNPEGVGMPTTLELRGGDIEWMEPRWPEPEKYVGSWASEDEWVYVHHDQVKIALEGTLRGEGELGALSARIEGQVCEADGQCYLVKLTFANEGASETAGDGGGAGAVEEVGTDEASVGTIEKKEKKKGGGLWELIVLAIGGGIFALLMPCTYPMIPITISFFTKQAESRGGNVLGLSLLYGLGIVLIFVIIGLTVGPLIIPFATHPITNLVLGAMFLVFAAVLFGALTLNPPAFMMSMAGKASMTGGLLGVFLMGMTLVLTSFTCTAPFVGSLLSVAASGGAGVSHIVIGMGVFGLTMATPFVFLSLLPGKIQAMPSSGEWMDTLKVTLGFVEIAAALKFFSNADLVLNWQMLSRELFLLLWAAIFITAALYLFGLIRITGHGDGGVGPGRLLGAMFFLLLGAYCWHGYNGHRMDALMTAIIPNYSSALGGGNGGNGGGASQIGHMGAHTIIIDDLERAKRVAREEGKPVLLNFTGFV